MRAGSAIASSTRHVFGVGLQALLIAAIVAIVAFAAATVAGSAPGGAGSVFAGRVAATIAFADASRLAASSDAAVSGDVLFAVTQSRTSDDVMWVTNRCFNASGVEVSRLDLPVRWATWASLEGVVGPFATAGVTCTAYATWKPWTNRSISGATMTYDVQN